MNTVADACEFDWDMRLAPGQAMADITGRFDAYCAELLARAGVPDGAATITRDCTACFPGLAPRANCAFGDALKAATGAGDFDAMRFGTEAGFFQDAGFAVYVCGPGDVKDAHTPGESLPVHELAACLDLLARLSGDG